MLNLSNTKDVRIHEESAQASCPDTANLFNRSQFLPYPDLKIANPIIFQQFFSLHF